MSGTRDQPQVDLTHGEGHAEAPSGTPLDLLINALAETADHAYTSQATSAQAGAYEPIAGSQAVQGGAPTDHAGSVIASSSRPPSQVCAAADENTSLPGHKRQRASSPSARPHKSARTTALQAGGDHVVGSNPALTSVPALSTSTIEVWHPTSAQKSYGKERRILAPPPILRISGPILPSISTLTLNTTTHASPAVVSGSQTHRILSVFDSPLPDTTVRGKRAERQEQKRRLKEAARNAGFGATLPKARINPDVREREVLLDGLAFPGLWVGEESGKVKEFLLELRVGLEREPGITRQTDSTRGPVDAQGMTTAEAVGVPAAEHRSEDYQDLEGDTSLTDVLDPASMEALQPLAEAVRQVNQQARLAAEYPVDLSSSLQDGLAGPHASPSAHGDPSHSLVTSNAPDDWGTFTSGPLRIVSKPSQKTAKARSMASCFSVNASFSLWTRIHGQTVRTKYMKFERDDLQGDNPEPSKARLTSRTGKWTPFRFEVLQRARPPIPEPDGPNRPKAKAATFDDAFEEERMTYGSIVVLVDLQSGTRSDPIKLVKIESGLVRVGDEEGHPVSELQRIGLVRITGDAEDTSGGGRSYLSAPGARLGGGEMASGSPSGRRKARAKAQPIPLAASRHESPPAFQPDTLSAVERDLVEEAAAPSHTLSEISVTEQEHKAEADGEARRVVSAPETPVTSAENTKKVKTRRHALAAAVLAEDEAGNDSSTLTWHPAERSTQLDKEGREIVVEKVDDWMSWIIGGVSVFSYSFFSTAEETTPADFESIDPIPRILVPPTFDSEENTLQLHISDYFFARPDSDHLSVIEPLDIYLGPLGPLFVTTWKSTAPRNIPTPAIPYDVAEGPDQSITRHHDGSIVISSYPASMPHVIAVVHMPPTDQIIKTMQSSPLPAAQDTIVDQSAEARAESRNNGGIDRQQQSVKDLGEESGVIKPGDTDGDGEAEDQDHDPSKTTSGPATSDTPWFADLSQVDHPILGSEGSRLPVENAGADELSIAAALEMSNGFSTLDQLASFEGNFPAHDIELAERVQIDQQLDDRPTSADAGDLIDPALSDLSFAPAASTALGETADAARTSSTTGPVGAAALTEPQGLSLYPATTPSIGTSESKQDSMSSLPFLMVRKHDGMVFKVGKSLLAQRLDERPLAAVSAGGTGVVSEHEGVASGTKWILRVVDE
ncbi:hypothetical protein IAU60_004205 [Kwoniella sp. DSM 27419]